jgi:actin-related protein
MMVGMDQKDCYIGEEVNSKHEVLNLSYPIDYGIINDMKDMEKIWSHASTKINANFSGSPILMTEPPLNPKKKREKLIEVMFETFNCHSFYLAIQ